MEKDAVKNSTETKKRYFFKSVRFKFICWFLVTASVPLIIVGTVAYLYGGKLATKRIFDHLISDTTSN